MTLQTQTFTSSKKEFFMLLLAMRARKNGWIFIAIWVITVVYWITQREASDIGLSLLLFSIIYPLIVIASIWGHAYSDQNRMFYRPRHFVLENNTLTGIINGEQQGLIARADILRSMEVRNIFVFHISKTQFIWIPFSAFEKKEDIRAFRSWLSGK